MPKVSIIIPNYNHAPYLPLRIETVLAQTFADFEVLLLDDASTDDSVAVFTPLVAGDSRVRIVLNEKNSGSGYRQWDKGIQLATGDYIWIAESDDWADPQLLEKMVPLLDQNPNIGVVYCQSWRVTNENGEKYNNVAWTADFGTDHWKDDYIESGIEECRRYLCQKNTLPNASAVLFRRRLYHEVGGIPDGMRLCADWCLWLKLLKVSDVAYVAQPLNYFRQVSGSVTQQTKRDGTIAEESYAVAQWVLEEFAFGPESREAIFDKMFYVWTHPQLHDGGTLPFARNLAIYRKARQIDPRLNRRLIVGMLRHMSHQRPGLRRPVRMLRILVALPGRLRQFAVRLSGGRP
jgi:glycosyltransferase involved in cell wall biosynthesis